MRIESGIFSFPRCVSLYRKEATVNLSHSCSIRRSKGLVFPRPYFPTTSLVVVVGVVVVVVVGVVVAASGKSTYACIIRVTHAIARLPRLCTHHQTIPSAIVLYVVSRSMHAKQI